MSGSSAIGSVITISASALKAIDDVDKKLQSLQTTMTDTAKKANTEFTNMATATKSFSQTLDDIITKMGKVGTSAQSIASSMQGAWGSITAGSGSAAVSVQQLAGALQSASGGMNGLSSTKATQQVGQLNIALAQAAQNLDKVTSSIGERGKDEGIENIKRAIQDLLVQLQKARQDIDLYKQAIGSGKVTYFEWGQTGLKAAEQEAESLMRRISALDETYRKLKSSAANANDLTGNTLDSQRNTADLAKMSEYYKQLEKSSAEQAKNAAKQEKEAQKRAEAEEKAREREAKAAEKASEREQKAAERAAAAAEKKAEREAKAAEKLQASEQRQQYLSTPTSVISNNSESKTLLDHVNAIKELEQARLRLNTTDANYKRNLASVNEAIRQHSQALHEAGVNANNLREQTSYLAQYIERWATRTAALFSINFAQNVINQIVEVRGQFEMSQRSLEAILQDKSKADEIFNKTVELAVQSPFQIKDLVDYTRQLSAYRIESDKLYDTTKRLADVSAGLGVDMGRLILAYGQVKAAAYLRGSEVRQFTEAGINMYGELQSYFKEVKGEAYTTEQIVDMISKRMVSFADVEQVFQRMTDKGGTFYNMQAIQAETLQGKVANLEDSLDVMLNSIGKDNEGMLKGAVSTATELLNHWEGIATAAKGVAATMALMLVYSKQMGATKFTEMFTANLGSTRTSLGTVTAMVDNTKGAIALLGASFKSAGSMIANFSKNLAGAFVTNAPLVALTALVSALIESYQIWSKWSDRIDKANEQMVESKGVIGSLAASYRDLSAAAKNLEGEQLSENVSERKNALQKLIDAAAKDGLTIELNIEAVDEAKLDQTFKTIEKKYADFIDTLNVVQKNHASSQAWDTWFTDGIGDDMADYKDAVVDLLSTQSQLEAVISGINANYKEATKDTKAYFDEIRAGQKDGESNYDYMTRMVKVIKELNAATTHDESLVSQRFGRGAGSNFKDILSKMDGGWDNLWSGVTHAQNKLESDFDDVLGKLKGKSKVEIKAIIDRVAAENDWDQYSRELAYKKFGISVTIDKAKAEQEVSWVDDYLTKFFAQKKYGVTLQIKKISDDKAMDNFIDKGDKEAKAAKRYAELEKRIAAVGKRTKTIKVDDSIRSLFNAGDTRLSGNTIQVSTLKSLISEYKKAATQTAEALGVDPFEKQKTKAQKAQRDLLNERIQLLKDLASKYEELSKWETKSKALADVRSYFSDAAKNVGMDITSFVPDKETVAAKIKAIAQQYKELTKRGSGLRIAADLQFDVDKENLKKQLENVKKEVNNMFDSLSLFEKLKDSGLTNLQIKKMFPEIDAKSYEDIRESIEKNYSDKWGSEKTLWAPEVAEQYNTEINKLNKQQNQQTISEAQELLKSYGTSLKERLQLDTWYFSERAKISNNANISLDQRTQQEMLDNLKKKYEKKSSELTWNEFKGSDSYIKIFENLQGTSTRVLDYMSERLSQIKEQLKDQDPTEVKTIVSEIQKIEDIKNARNPFKAFTSGLREMVKAMKDYKKLGGDKAWVALSKQNGSESEQIQAQQKVVAQLRAEYEQISNNCQATQEEVTVKEKVLKKEEDHLKTLEDSNNKTKESLKLLQNAQNASDRSKKKFSSSVQDMTSMVSSLTSAFSSFSEAMTGETNKELTTTLSIVDNIGQAIGNYYSGNYGGMAANIIGVFTAIGELMSDDSGLSEAITRQSYLLDLLQRKYEKLKSAIENGIDMGAVEEATQQAQKNIEAQITAIEAQIALEERKKSTDTGAINSYKSQIEDLKDSLEELKETETEVLGGFGSDSNYKSAAEAFAEAWVDAFNDCSSGIEALTDKWDEYFDNLITKQLLMRAATKYIQPLLKAVDAALEETSDGGTALTKSETEYIQKLREASLAGFDEYASELMNALNIKPRGSVELSGLQEGIEGVTEATAQALESILNSMRYYLATQQADVRTIRDTLISRLGSVSGAVQGTSGESSQMITILQEQTGYLKALANNFDKVIKPNHSKGGSGIKVFLN